MVIGVDSNAINKCNRMKRFAAANSHYGLFHQIIVHTPTDDQKSCPEGVQWQCPRGVFYCSEMCPERGPMAMMAMCQTVRCVRMGFKGNALGGILHQVVSRGGSMVMYREVCPEGSKINVLGGGGGGGGISHQYGCTIILWNSNIP